MRKCIDHKGKHAELFPSYWFLTFQTSCTAWIRTRPLLSLCILLLITNGAVAFCSTKVNIKPIFKAFINSKLFNVHGRN